MTAQPSGVSPQLEKALQHLISEIRLYVQDEVRRQVRDEVARQLKSAPSKPAVAPAAEVSNMSVALAAQNQQHQPSTEQLRQAADVVVNDPHSLAFAHKLVAKVRYRKKVPPAPSVT